MKTNCLTSSSPSHSLYEIPTVSPSSFSQHFRSLLEEVDETDSIHDVTLQAGDRAFPAHKYILSMRSEFFRKQLAAEHGENEEGDGEVRKSEDAVGCDMLVLEKVPAEMLEQVLKFVYTDSCELLAQGARPRGSMLRPSHGQIQDQETDQGQGQLITSLQGLSFHEDLRGRSALEVREYGVV